MPTVSKTTAEAALQITRGNASWSAGLATPAAVSFAFRASAPGTMPDGTDGFSLFNVAQITATLQALQAWSDVANLTFTRVTDPGSPFSNNATMLFGNYATGSEGAAAFAYFPSPTSTAFDDIAGDTWVNSTIDVNIAPAVGNYGLQTLVHEIGHALGFDHPGAYNAGGNPLTYAANAEYIQDTRQYSVMSYFEETNTGANYNGSYASSPMLHDIAAAQRLYGANMTAFTGDTTYGFNSNTNRPWFSATSVDSVMIFAVWDAGGTDTLDFSGFSAAQSINLGAEAFSNVGGMTGNVVIAQNAVIENAKGGSGNDTIVGNAVANAIFGNAGVDTVSALGGADTIFGGAGSDIIDGGEGNDTIVGNDDPFALEADQLFGGIGNDTIYADRTDALSGGDGTDNLYAVNAFDFTLDMAATFFEFAQLDFGNDFVTAAALAVGAQIFSGGGNDVIVGSAFNDFIYSSAGNDSMDGGGGNDTLIGDVGIDSLTGGEGTDFLYFDAEDNFLSGGNGFDAGYVTAGAGVTVNMGLAGLEFVQDFAGGSDTILASTLAVGVQAYTGLGNDTVDGSAFDDVVFALDGNDTLTGNAGNDVLVGGTGADTLSGGAGLDALYGNGGSGGDGVQDIFRFQHTGAANADAVYDFQAGIDKIDLTAFGSTFASVAIANAAGSAIVYLNGQVVCTIVGVIPTAVDFIM